MRPTKTPLSASDISSANSVNPPVETLSSDTTLRVCLHRSDDAKALANIQFSDPSSVVNHGSFNSELMPLDGGSSLQESWFNASHGVTTGQSGDVVWRATEDYLFAAVSGPCHVDADVADLTDSLYSQLVAVVLQSQTQNILRCWNYLPDIHAGMEQGDTDNERYKQFCTGRLRALTRAGLTQQTYPSASAVGHHGQRLTVHLLAGRQAGNHLGNDQQVEAYQYPRQYGVSSPSFARATLLGSLLFISGTASIIGHASCHPGDLDRQLATTLDNINHLLEKANKCLSDVRYLRVYLRHSDSYQVACDFVNTHFLNATAVFLQADICRADLLVEIECFCD